MSTCLIRFDRDRPSWLRDAVILSRSSLCAATTELVPRNNHEPPTHLDFCLLRCCVAMTTSSRSSMCNCDQESMSLEPSSLAILHWESVNKDFVSDLHDCSLASSSSSTRLEYLYVKRASRVTVFNAYFVRQIIIFTRLSLSRNHKSHKDLRRHDFAR
jgi:hypothetical protein